MKFKSTNQFIWSSVIANIKSVITEIEVTATGFEPRTT